MHPDVGGGVILTGREIEREWRNGRIVIEPFVPTNVNPNSYNFRLGSTLRVYNNVPLDPRSFNTFDEITIPDEGYVLEPCRLYLAHTIEVLGSDYYAPTFAARSSIARLGIFINLSASLGDIGYKGQWTLQLFSLNRVRIYPGMTIGQMMWWRPQGEIVLYDGKYQGAVGPRSSDIHVDFEKQLARQRFPGLGDLSGPAEVGGKFAALAASSQRFRVPAAFAVPAGEFVDATTPAQAEALDAAFADLRATIGAFYAESVARIQSIGAQIRLPETSRGLLRARLTQIFGDIDGKRFAVRSSGLDEDAETSTQAGVHHSLLNVTGLDGIVAAIERCWASYYEAPAVAARVRAGDYRSRPRLAVIVQAMVDPRLAGVAFTGLDELSPDAVVIEYVEGLASELVSGVATPIRTDSGHLTDPALSGVVELARALREHRGQHVDVEWAIDGDGTHLIQVRPLTATIQGTNTSGEPVAQAYDLYFDELPATVHLGDVAAVYGGYVTKRGPAYRLAMANGLAVGAGWVIQFNGRGLHDAGAVARLREVLGRSASTECVLDLGDNLRQIVVPRDDVVARLIEATGARPDGTILHAAIVRDFVRGELGMISQLTGDGLIVEYAAEGLMALNRGVAGGHTITVADPRRPEAAVAGPTGAPLLPHLDKLARFTAAMQAEHGTVTLEWVFAAGEPYFVDYSVLGADEATVSAEGVVQISPGTARGPLLRLEENEMLRRLSIGPAVSVDKATDVTEYDGMARMIDKVTSLPERPIIQASLPYAVLSVLIGHVAGFVFDQGSTLGHLAILLREAGVPAVTAPGFASEGDVVIADGKVITATHGQRS